MLVALYYAARRAFRSRRIIIESSTLRRLSLQSCRFDAHL